MDKIYDYKLIQSLNSFILNFSRRSGRTIESIKGLKEGDIFVVNSTSMFVYAKHRMLEFFKNNEILIVNPKSNDLANDLFRKIHLLPGQRIIFDHHWIELRALSYVEKSLNDLQFEYDMVFKENQINTNIALPNTHNSGLF
jgi:hypothetical protein